MQTLVLSEHDPDWPKQAADQIMAGAVVALPTETVYGLAGNARDPEAVARIYRAKGRPSRNPLIVHVSSVGMAQSIGVLDDRALGLAARFWPGPLTLVVPLHPTVMLAGEVTAGLDSIALRQPKGALGSLVQQVNTPLAAPSANRSGHVSPTRAEHVLHDLGGEIPLVVDGGETAIGLESTIVDLRPEIPSILRPGALSAEALGLALKSASTDDDAPAAPGMMSSHYAPTAQVKLNVLPGQIEASERYLGFGDHSRVGELNLSSTADMAEAARNLFSMLRQADQEGVSCIAVAPIPNVGLGAAINDRLSRAASPKSR